MSQGTAMFAVFGTDYLYLLLLGGAVVYRLK
jgi:hypothetical protein